MRYYLFLVFVFCMVSGVSAQHIISGKITNSTSGRPLLGVTVKHVESKRSSGSDRTGIYTLSLPDEKGTLLFSAVGYKRQLVPLSAVQGRKSLDIVLEEERLSLEEVVVTAPKRKRYSNKNNPMVELIRKVIERRDDNNALKSSDATFSEYEKLSMSLGILNEKAADSRILKKFGFLRNGLDTVKLKGRSLIPIFINEKTGKRTISLIERTQYTLLGENQSRVDQYLDEDGIDEYLDKIYGMTDIYEPDIAIGNRRFLSPIASLGPSFYKYYLVDTLKDSAPWRVKMRVEPRNREDALFSGYLYIDIDGSYALSKAELTINSATNINWVNSLHIVLNYTKNKDSKYYLSRSDVKIDLGIFKKGMNMFGEKIIIRNPLDSSKNLLADIGPTSSRGKNSANINWELIRPEKLSTIESQAYRNIDSLKNSRSFRNIMTFGAVVTTGYIGRGWFEVGSIPSFFSFNPVEGSRFKFGGNTTDEFSKRLVFEGYGAYGTKDKKFKYNVAAIYSLNGESIYKYPVRSLTIRAISDVRVPGQDLNFFENDNFLLSFRRGENDRMFYYDRKIVEYNHEFDNHISIKLGFKKETILPGGVLLFPKDEDGKSKINTTALTGEFRWAPGEKIYQGKRFRRIINTGKPIFSLAADIGIKGILGGDYNFQRFVFTAKKRFYLSQLGFSDAVFESGIQFGKLPYPLMMIHRANQTYAYQLNSFNLMNSMEFMSDRYSSLQVQHAFNGFIFNKIPLLKKLDLREWASVKVLYGHVRDENRIFPNIYEPTKSTNSQHLFGLNKAPYIEGSLGISNIFKVLRVDIVRRFSYLNNPMVSKWGVRARIGIDF